MISAASRSVVTTTTRTAMSIRVSVDMGCCVPRAACCVLRAAVNAARGTEHAALRLTDLSDEREHRHVHRDDDAADGDAEERDEDRLEELHQAGHGDVHFFFVEVGDLAEHGVE